MIGAPTASAIGRRYSAPVDPGPDWILVAAPAPGTYHQSVSRHIQFQLYRQLEETGLAQVFNAPTDVELSRVDIVQPDIAVIARERERIISPSGIGSSSVGSTKPGASAAIGSSTRTRRRSPSTSSLTGGTGRPAGTTRRSSYDSADSKRGST